MEYESVLVLCVIGVFAILSNEVVGLSPEAYGDWENPTNKFREEHLIRDTEHLKEHLDKEAKIDFDKLTPQEVDFLYFQIHDTNKDGSLDGIELLQSIQHSMYHSIDDFVTSDEQRKQLYLNVLKYTTNTVDKILEEDDLNNNGYLEYAEFSHSRRTKTLTNSWKRKKQTEDTKN